MYKGEIEKKNCYLKFQRSCFETLNNSNLLSAIINFKQ